jgi:hypothetical protein
MYLLRSRLPRENTGPGESARHPRTAGVESVLIPEVYWSTPIAIRARRALSRSKCLCRISWRLRCGRSPTGCVRLLPVIGIVPGGRSRNAAELPGDVTARARPCRRIACDWMLHPSPSPTTTWSTSGSPWIGNLTRRPAARSRADQGSERPDPSKRIRALPAMLLYAEGGEE